MLSGGATLPSPSSPKALIATSVWWPAPARLALRLIHYGCRVAAVCPPGHVLGKVRGIERVYPYRGLTSLQSLETAIQEFGADLVIPGDDRVVWQLHELHQSRPGLRPLIEASLGDPAHYRVTASRAELLDVARELEIRVPETRHLRSEGDIRQWFSDVAPCAVLKGDGTFGGAGVYIATSERAATAAFERLTRGIGVAAACKRLLINCDPVALWEWRRKLSRSMVIQRFIAGRPANAMFAAWRGELLGVVAVEVLSTQGPTGAALVVRAIDSPEITAAAERLTKRLKLTGFGGLDFVIAAETGLPHLIEMNPRCTQLGHLALHKRSDLAGLLYAKLAGRCEPPLGMPIDNPVVAFFPQSIVWSPNDPHIRTGHLDAPWEDAALARELLAGPWPERQWPARLYHLIHPPERLGVVEFEGRR